MTAGSVVTIDNDPVTLGQEIVTRIVKANVFHHLAQQRDIRRRFAGRHPTADHLAQSIRRITSRSRWRI
jgi:hypothetical protein